MMQKGSSSSARKLVRLTFAERLCGYHGQPADTFSALAWQHGASRPTRILRRLILLFAPSYFQAEDVHVANAAECCWRQDIVEELALMRVSLLRRGIWRRLGIGLNGPRLLKYYDHMVAMEVIENEAARVADKEARIRSGMGTTQQLS